MIAGQSAWAGSTPHPNAISDFEARSHDVVHQPSILSTATDWSDNEDTTHMQLEQAAALGRCGEY